MMFSSAGCVGAAAAGLALRRPEETDTEKIFKHFFSQSNLFSSIPHNLWSPPTDVYETTDKYVVRIEIPGIQDADSDVEIELTHNVLTVRGHRCDTTCDTKLGFHQMEIHYGYFEKVITLPHAINPEARQGTYSDGFLKITIDKAPRQEAKRRIDIES
ncbi:MAG: Hsp20/alpha crystallin family protein [Planctomycetota bacterium]